MQVTPTTDPTLRARFYPLKRFAARIMCHRWVGQAISLRYRDRIPCHGSVIDTSLGEIRPEVKASLWWGIYESAEARFVNQFLRSDLDVVELGSSLGVVSSLIARKLQPARRLICVEANHHLLATIQNNVSRNSKVSVQVVHGAVSYPDEKSGKVTFVLGKDNTESHLAGAEFADAFLLVPAFTLERILNEHQVVEYALVSDIEGAEVGIIESGRGTLANCKQLIIELHDIIWQGHRFRVADMKQRLIEVHGFQLQAQHGPVYVFSK
jgi:FkbM family methyltransferase